MKWKNRVIHAGVLVLVFLAAVVVFGYVTNKKNSNMTTDMGAATRPQIAFSYNGYSLNDLPGYKNEMDLTGVRDPSHRSAMVSFRSPSKLMKM